MRSATAEEIDHWDDMVVANPDGGQILQTRAWGEFKRGHGWMPNYLVAGAVPRIAILELRRELRGLGALAYLPKGPGIVRADQLAEVLDGYRALPHPPFAVKLEPELLQTDDTAAALRDLGLEKSRHDVQISRSTIVVDLRADEDTLIASFKPKCRYNIRLAARRGVEVTAVDTDEAGVDAMYTLMSVTRDRAGFTLRSREYFAGYWRLQAAAGQGQMFLARLGGQILAGVYVTFCGRRAWYKDGGSIKDHAEMMAPHLLQWEVMRWLRAQGVEDYDLVAVPPPDQLTPAHPLYGLYRFKSGFSDRITEFVGTWDLPLHRRRFMLWNAAAERAAHQWAYRVRHDLLY